MTFTYNNGVPAANNNPSVDQPDMLTNAQSIESLIAVDHISFNATNGGQHKQLTFNGKNAPSAQTDPQSVLYTGSGTASSVSQLLYRNQNGIFQISAIRAWALCSSAGVIATQSINVSTVTRNSDGNYSIVLTTNAVSSSNFSVLVSCTKSSAGILPLTPSYSITGVGTFNLLFNVSGSSTTDPTSFSFQVIQI